MRRARVRNGRAYSYAEAQRLVDSGVRDGTIAVLAEIGPQLLALEHEGGGELEVPEQIIHVADGAGMRSPYAAPPGEEDLGVFVPRARP